MSSNKTKDWLKNQLVAHGVPLPASSAKKEEYQRLYDEQVRPSQGNADFSSDDDGEGNSVQDVGSTASQNLQEAEEKYMTWVQRLSDSNLFTALKAHGKDVGGIVDSTRVLYQNMLIGLMKADPQKSIVEIQNYLSSHEDARQLWSESGMELNGDTNGHPNGNGHEDNGYSDTDDDTVETASRASRSSRASSNRVTPLRTTHPSGEPSASPLQAPLVRRRRDDVSAGGSLEQPEAVPPRPTLLSDSQRNIAPTPSSTSDVFNKPVTMRKTVVSTYESTRTQSYSDGRHEVDTPKVKAGSNAAMTVLKYVMLLLIVVVFPFILAYVYPGFQAISRAFTGSDGPSDELDVLLQSLDEQGNEGGSPTGV